MIKGEHFSIFFFWKFLNVGYKMRPLTVLLVPLFMIWTVNSNRNICMYYFLSYINYFKMMNSFKSKLYFEIINHRNAPLSVTFVYKMTRIFTCQRNGIILNKLATQEVITRLEHPVSFPWWKIKCFDFASIRRFLFIIFFLHCDLNMYPYVRLYLNSFYHVFTAQRNDIFFEPNSLCMAKNVFTVQRMWYILIDVI